jgi:hypothetical protein
MSEWASADRSGEFDSNAPTPDPAAYRPLRRRAGLARIGLALTALASVVAVVFDVYERSLLARVASGEPVSFGELDASDNRQLVLSVVLFLLWILTTVFFIAWLHRAYTNLRALGVDGLRYGTGWAIGAWFVPFLNLVRPIQIVNDVWRGSRPYLDHRFGWRGRPVPRVFAFWWAAWLIAGALGGVAAQLLLGAEEPGQFEASSAAFIASDLLSAVAAILALVVVDRTTARQTASAAHAAGGEQPAPPTQWLRGRPRLAAAAGLCAVAASLGALVVAVQPAGTTPASEGEPPANGSQTFSLTDDFSDPESGWAVEDGQDASYAFEEGEYRITVKSPDITWFSLLSLGFVIEPIQVEADARLGSPISDESAVGLGCFVSDLYGYLATISPDGYYAIQIDPVDTEELEVLVEGTASNELGTPAGTSRLGLVCDNGPPAIITLTVDGRTVAEARHDEGLGEFGVVALLVSAGADEATGYFDDFAVTSPSGR